MTQASSAYSIIGADPSYQELRARIESSAKPTESIFGFDENRLVQSCKSQVSSFAYVRDSSVSTKCGQSKQLPKKSDDDDRVSLSNELLILWNEEKADKIVRLEKVNRDLLFEQAELNKKLIRQREWFKDARAAQRRAEQQVLTRERSIVKLEEEISRSIKPKPICFAPVRRVISSTAVKKPPLPPKPTAPSPTVSSTRPPSRSVCSEPRVKSSHAPSVSEASCWVDGVPVGLQLSALKRKLAMIDEQLPRALVKIQDFERKTLALRMELKEARIAHEQIRNENIEISRKLAVSNNQCEALLRAAAYS